MGLNSAHRFWILKPDTLYYRTSLLCFKKLIFWWKHRTIRGKGELSKLNIHILLLTYHIYLIIESYNQAKQAFYKFLKYYIYKYLDYSTYVWQTFHMLVPWKPKLLLTKYSWGIFFQYIIVVNLKIHFGTNKDRSCTNRILYWSFIYHISIKYYDVSNH